MMKKRSLFVLLLLLCLFSLPALADEAQDITAACEITGSTNHYKIERICDRDYKTQWESNKQKAPYFTVKTPADKPCYGVYLCSGMETLYPWEVRVQQGGEWVTVAASTGKYAHEYVALDGLTEFRVCLASGTKQVAFNVLELFLLGEGDKPEYVQVWQDAPEKVDLLMIVAHPDDEELFFGGTLATYAGEQGKSVMVAYMTCNYIWRRSELLNGLWHCGVSLYPGIGNYWDKYSTKLDKGYEYWGKTTTLKRVTELLRRYKPDVVLTHDVNGEYGHCGHRVCADATLKCIAYAADATKYPESAKEYGIWQVKKAYLHLYPENQITMDWDVPLEEFDGKTGMEVAVEAFHMHVSQLNAGQKINGVFTVFEVEPKDSDYSCYLFGLAHSTVGEDVEKNDFFENIE